LKIWSAPAERSADGALDLISKTLSKAPPMSAHSKYHPKVWFFAEFSEITRKYDDKNRA